MNEEVQDKIKQGEELMAVGHYEEARAVFGSVLAVDKGNFDAHYDLGNAYVNLGCFDKGIESFKRALVVRPNSGEARYSLACALFLDNRYAEAVREFNRCEESGFTPVEMYQILETIFVSSDDPVQAIRCANKAIALEPLNPRHYVDKAQLYVLRGQLEEAVGCLREVEGLLPDAAEPYIVESQVLLRSGDHDASLAALDRALSRFPEDASLLLAKGRALNEAERYAEARRVLDQARAAADGNEALLVSIDFQEGLATAGMGDLDSSIAALERAVAVDPSAEEAMLTLVTECAAARRFEDCERFCDQVTAGGLDVDAHTMAAAVYWKAASMKELGRAGEARAAFREATGTLRRITIEHPGLVEGYAYRLMCHKELGEYDKARDLADHIIQLDPNNPAGYAFKAEVLSSSGDEEGAATLRAKTRELNPDFRF